MALYVGASLVRICQRLNLAKLIHDQRVMYDFLRN